MFTKNTFGCLLRLSGSLNTKIFQSPACFGAFTACPKLQAPVANLLQLPSYLTSSFFLGVEVAKLRLSEGG